MVKARLVTKRLEEVDILQVDCPTCNKESLRLASYIMVSKQCKCNGIEVRTTFLQGKQID